MSRLPRSAGLWATVMLCACGSTPDRFYTLTPLPESARPALSAPVVHVLMNLSVPALVDRAEMVISTSQNNILVLDHERWAVPLSEQVAQTLARDIEKARADILVGDRGFDQAASPAVTLRVDIVRMSARRGGQASIEAHWRIVDAVSGTDEVGSAAFEAPVGTDYASVARAYSQTLVDLATTLAAALKRR